MPAVLTDLPPLNSLVKVHVVYLCLTTLYHAPLLPCTAQSGATSPFIRYSVINVLYAYCYIIRLFNGEHNELALQASQVSLA